MYTSMPYVVQSDTKDQIVRDAGIDQNPVPNEVRNTAVVRLIVQKFLVAKLVSMPAKSAIPAKNAHENSDLIFLSVEIAS